MSENPFDPRSLDELPAELSIFPLAGATLLPGTQLPLNIFEPRYLNMVLDALGEHRLVGMIQPDPARQGPEPVMIYGVGCAGRIVAFNETADGRLLISLQGVCRFRVREELPLRRGYRRVRPDFESFAVDLRPAPAFGLDRGALRDSMSTYLEHKGIRVDWDALEKMSDGQMVDFLSMHLPLSLEDKQALVEATDPPSRAASLMALTRMASAEPPGAGATRH